MTQQSQLFRHLKRNSAFTITLIVLISVWAIIHVSARQHPLATLSSRLTSSLTHSTAVPPNSDHPLSPSSSRRLLDAPVISDSSSSSTAAEESLSSSSSSTGPADPRPKPPPEEEDESDSPSALTIVLAIIGALLGILCLERLYSSCKRVYMRRRGLSFTRVANPNDSFNPDQTSEELQLGRRPDGEDHL
jgi:hypothetical protein